MKKLISLALALVLSLSLIACGAKQDDTPQTGADTPDTTQTAEKQKLIVGFDAEFPPFGFIAADGSYDGFDLAMAEELCSRLGWDFEAVPIVWDSKDAELAAGTINCIWNGFTYTGRENDYTWSDPYVDNSIVMVVKADSGISSLADLAGKSVMAQAASSAVDAINANESLKSSLKEVWAIRWWMAPRWSWRTITPASWSSSRAAWTPSPPTSASPSSRSPATRAAM